MNRSIVRVLAILCGFACSAAAAAPLSNAEYRAARDAIAAEYKSARASCVSMPSDARSRCYMDAKSQQKAARAELEARQGPAAAAKETPRERIKDGAITAKVKAAMFEEPSLKSAEINVETHKGIVQLSGFVRSRTDINKAVQVARRVNGVKSVQNVMIVKGQQ